MMVTTSFGRRLRALLYQMAIAQGELPTPENMNRNLEWITLPGLIPGTRRRLDRISDVPEALLQDPPIGRRGRLN
jgi:hypothetical protein